MASAATFHLTTDATVPDLAAQVLDHRKARRRIIAAAVSGDQRHHPPAPAFGPELLRGTHLDLKDAIGQRYVTELRSGSVCRQEPQPQASLCPFHPWNSLATTPSVRK